MHQQSKQNQMLLHRDLHENPIWEKTTNCFYLLCNGLQLVYQHQLPSFLLATTRRRVRPICLYQHQLPNFLLAATRRRLQHFFLYQHQLDRSSNSLVLRHQPEGSYNHLPCTTLPPGIVYFFMLYFFLQCCCSSSFHFIQFLSRSYCSFNYFIFIMSHLQRLFCQKPTSYSKFHL